MRASLEDLVKVLTRHMTVADMAKTALHIQTSQIIRSARRKKGWSQKDLADKMGVKQSLVSRWESNECNFTIDTLVDIADTLGLSVQCLLKYDDTPVSVKPAVVENAAANNAAYKKPDFSNTIPFPEKPQRTTGGAA